MGGERPKGRDSGTEAEKEYQSLGEKMRHIDGTGGSDIEAEPWQEKTVIPEAGSAPEDRGRLMGLCRLLGVVHSLAQVRQ